MSDEYGEFGEPEQLEVVNADVVRNGDGSEDVGEVDVEGLTAQADRLEELHDELRAQLVGQDEQHQS